MVLNSPSKAEGTKGLSKSSRMEPFTYQGILYSEGPRNTHHDEGPRNTHHELQEKLAGKVWHILKA
jgi:hypothetical protein